jgi:hypothetical protein
MYKLRVNGLCGYNLNVDMSLVMSEFDTYMWIGVLYLWDIGQANE